MSNSWSFLSYCVKLYQLVQHTFLSSRDANKEHSKRTIRMHLNIPKHYYSCKNNLRYTIWVCISSSFLKGSMADNIWENQVKNCYDFVWKCMMTYLFIMFCIIFFLCWLFSIFTTITVWTIMQIGIESQIVHPL